MAKFILKPNDFQKQVDSFKSTTETVSALKYTLEKNGISLQSIDKYEECITAMNDLITTFAEFAEMDCNSMQRIKAKWMNTDSDMATKTLGEILSAKISGN